MMATLTWTARSLRNTLESFVRCQFKHEVSGETIDVALDGTIQRAGGDAVKFCQIGVQQHFLSPCEMNQFFDPLDGD